MRLILLLVFASVIISHGEEAVSGRWEGSVRIPERELTLIVDFAQANGAWVGSIIMPGLNLKGTPLADVEVRNSDISFTLKTAQGLQAVVKAHLNSDGSLAGEFAQAGNTAPLVLKRVGPAQVEFPPHSTVVTKELEGEWKGEYKLFGYPRKVTIKLTNSTSNEATAQFVVVGKKVNNLPVDLITQEGDLLTIDSHETGISYEGRLGKDKVRGTLIEGGIEVPLILQRVQ